MIDSPNRVHLDTNQLRRSFGQLVDDIELVLSNREELLTAIDRDNQTLRIQIGRLNQSLFRARDRNRMLSRRLRHKSATRRKR